MFKHPLKSEAKDTLENLVKYLTIMFQPLEIINPYKVMKLWIKWETLELQALLEAIDVKSVLEGKKAKRLSKKESNMKDLQKLNNGKNTIKTLFLS